MGLKEKNRTAYDMPPQLCLQRKEEKKQTQVESSRKALKCDDIQRQTQ